MLRAAVPGPIDLFELHCRHPERYPFLLQSAATHPLAARYDLLFAFPGEALVLPQDAQRDFFGELSLACRASAQDSPSDLPFIGGWFVLLGYEAARMIESRLQMPRSPHGLPDALAVRCPAALIYDRQLQRVELVAEEDASQLDRMRSDLDGLAKPGPQLGSQETTRSRSADLLAGFSEDHPQRFVDGVNRILEYLRAGDVFQVNLSRGWHAQLATGRDYRDVYRALRATNPAPFAGLARWQDHAVVSSSPERLVQIEGERVQTRPIAGTHARAGDPAEDRRQLEKLLASLKERAEHIMLIDLERNDLGRVCEPGSIAVSELMTTETYAHVHHIVSNVTGRLRPEAGPGEVLRAVFPGGTITGCPKVRAMEIIAELEGTGRGPYTGAMGYLCRSARLDMNILIRSLVCRGEAVSFRAGAGIVADSDPQAELQETRAKARGLLLALGAAT